MVLGDTLLLENDLNNIASNDTKTGPRLTS